MPIVRSGYAPRRRNGSTRAQRRAREAVLATARTCVYCGLPPRAADPFVAAHVVAAADGGPDTVANFAAAHDSCNAMRGRL